MSRECHGLHCRGTMTRVKTFAGDIEYVCGKCGARQKESGSRIRD